MMPVRCGDWDFDIIFGGLHELPIFQMEQTFNLGPDFYTSLLPSEDIWKKFDIGDVPMPDICTFTDDEGECSGGQSQKRPDGTTKEIRHHDCMWAGRCSSKDHKTVAKEVQPLPRPTARKATRAVKKDNVPVENKIVAVSSHATPSSSPVKPDHPCARPSLTVFKSASILKTELNVNQSAKPTKPGAGQSLLRTPVKNTVPSGAAVDSSYSLDSEGDSPRPDTPSSESEDDSSNLDFVFKHSLDIGSSVAAVCNDDSDNVLNYHGYRTHTSGDGGSSSDFDGDTDDFDDFDGVLSDPNNSVHVSEATGQNLKRPSSMPTPLSPLSDGNSSPAKKEEYFNSDHCYHLNKTVRLDNLGVQTPSDSEEEIDVVSFYDSEAQPTSRSSSCGGTSLPTNPSVRDRQQLQAAVKSAITKRPSPSVAPMRLSLTGKILVNVRATVHTDLSPKTKEKTRKKRTATFNVDDDRTIFKKGGKRMKRQYHHRLQHHKLTMNSRCKKGGSVGSSSPRSASSEESEPESLEKRSMHNNMERQRRIDLRNLVENLRALVPSVETKTRAAKVIILKEASVYCQDLTEEYEEKTTEAAALRQKQHKLRQRLSQLRKQCANLR